MLAEHRYHSAAADDELLQRGVVLPPPDPPTSRVQASRVPSVRGAEPVETAAQMDTPRRSVAGAEEFA